MKKWLCVTLCAMIFFTVIISTAFSSSAETNPSLNVVSLGDSIARAYGCKPEEAYGYLLAQQIRNETSSKGYTVDYVNYGHDGDTSSDLLDKLKTDTTVQNSIKDAGIVTISIGGNNLMRGLYREMATVLNLNINSATFENDLMAAFQNTNPQTLALELAPIFVIEPNVKAGTATPSERMRAIADAYQTDITAIFNQIQTLNSNAKIILTTVPNPTKDPILGTAMDPYFQMYNDYIRTSCPVANKIYIADSDTAFKEYTGSEALTFTNIDWTNPSKNVLNPHPTPFGHTIMEQAHYAQIKDYIESLPSIATTTSESVTTTSASTTASTTASTSASTSSSLTQTTSASTTAAQTTLASTSTSQTTPTTSATVVSTTKSSLTTAADTTIAVESTTAAVTTGTEAASPQTGDNALTSVFSLLSIAGVAGGIAWYRKKK